MITSTSARNSLLAIAASATLVLSGCGLGAAGTDTADQSPAETRTTTVQHDTPASDAPASGDDDCEWDADDREWDDCDDDRDDDDDDRDDDRDDDDDDDDRDD